MKKIFFRISLFLAIFLNQKLNCMAPDLDLRTYTPPQELSYLGGKFVFKLMNPEDMLRGHKFYSTTSCNPEDTCPIDYYRLEEFVPAANSARFVYSLEIKNLDPIIQGLLNPASNRFFLVVKISIDTQKKEVTIYTENTCFFFESRYRRLSHVSIPHFFSLILKANISELLPNFFGQCLTLFVTHFQLLDPNNFSSEYNRNIYQTFTKTQPGRIIHTLITECLHSIDLDKLMLEHPDFKDSKIFIYDHDRGFFKYEGSGITCPICNKPDSHFIVFIADVSFGIQIVNNIIDHKLDYPLSLELQKLHVSVD